MDDSEEHALVVKALTDGLGGCVEWDGKGRAHLVRTDPDLRGLTPEGIKKELISYVRNGGNVEQKPEKREWYRDLYKFFYMVIIPVKALRYGLFVEMRLTDADDPEFPVVTIVRAHPQTRL